MGTSDNVTVRLKDAEDINSVPDRLKAYGNMDVYEFFYKFSKLAPVAYASENNNVRLDVLPSYPDEFIATSDGAYTNPGSNFHNTITYTLTRREPASLRDHPFESAKEIKPRESEIKRSPTEDGMFLEIRRQWFDNLVQFDCWTRSNYEADELLKWAEDFLLRFTWYFKAAGIQEMFYFRGGRFTWGTGESEAMSMWRNPYKVRSFTYYLRTEKLWYINQYEIKNIIISADIDDYLYEMPDDGSFTV